MTSLAKAQIINLDNSSQTVECMFNPEQYSFEKRNTWGAGDAMGRNIPDMQFGQGDPTMLQMRLFFDTYSTAQSPDTAQDVRKAYTDAIWSLMLVDATRLKDPKSGKARPPKVRFQWGQAWSFDAVITRIAQSFTLFSTTGTPVRATLDITFQQIKDSSLLPSQNPTSGGVGGERVWTVKEGDTLSWIAYSEYGDSTRWRIIADANRLTKVRSLAPGTMLEIPRGY